MQGTEKKKIDTNRISQDYPAAIFPDGNTCRFVKKLSVDNKKRSLKQSSVNGILPCGPHSHLTFLWPRHAFESLLLILLIFFAFSSFSCAGCRTEENGADPCENVECPDDMVCIDGDCFHESFGDCTDNEDCPENAPICREGACMPCRNSSECPASKPICDAGICRICISNNECNENETCYRGKCRVEPGICITDSDCLEPELPYCDTNRQVCAECAADHHCTGLGQVCDRNSGVCTTPLFCISDDDCTSPELPRCEIFSATCVNCLTDEDCDIATGQHCDTSIWICMDHIPCNSNSDCGVPTPVCNQQSGDCVECLENEDCIAGTSRICDPASWTCTPGISCSSDDNCNDPALTRCDLHLGLCVDCLSSDDCEEIGATCDLESRLCRQALPCTGNNDCSTASTPLCNTETGFCVECLSGEDCTNPAVCIGGVCNFGPPYDGRPGSPCTQSDQCELSTATDRYAFCWGTWDDEWKWYQGYCTASCNSNSDCPEGSACLGGVCWDLCTHNSQCRPGYACWTLSDGLRQERLCAPACQPDIAETLNCEWDSDCSLGICDKESGKCRCSPVGGPCTGLGFCGPRADCILEVSQGQESGFTGGYCIIMECGEPGAPACPAGSSCYNIGDTTACLADCDPNDSWACPRPEYGCQETNRFILGGNCNDDSDCPSEAPDCFRAPGEIGTCIRSCTDDSDCNSSRGHVCTNIENQVYLCADPFHTGVCFPGCANDHDCGACSFDSDCDSGMVCNAGSCRRPCSSTTPCPAAQNETCIRGYCAARCLDSTDCPRGSSCIDGGCSFVAYRCDPVTGKCDPPCTENLDCDRSRICEPDEERCHFECTEADDCGPAGKCNTQTGLCEADCRTLPGLCSSDYFCNPLTGNCEERCGGFGEGSCEDPLICDILTGACVPECADIDMPCTWATEGEDCEPGYICNDGYCAPACHRTEDCEPGLICEWGVCTTCEWPRWRCDATGSGLCFNCYSENHCTSSRYCDIGGTYECIERCGGVNEGNFSCPSGTICDIAAGGRCIRPCTASDDCIEDPQRPYCHLETGLCGECSRDEHCTEDARPRCSPEMPICVRCLEDSDCLDNPEALACDTQIFECVECTENSHCDQESAPYCMTEWNICVECFEDEDCPAQTPLCDTNVYICRGCQTHEDCRDDDMCHPGAGECHPPCGDIPEIISRTGSVAPGPVPNTFVDEAGNTAGSALFSFADGQYAWSPEGEISAGASFYAFGFTLPPDAVITGIEVSVKGSVHGSHQNDDWYVAATLKDENGARGLTQTAPLEETDSIHVLGGDDLWGEEWNADDINSTGFGIILEVFDMEENAEARARIDHLLVGIIHTRPGETDCTEIAGEEPLYCQEDNLCHTSE